MAGHGAPPQEPVSACLFDEDLERDQRVDRQRHEAHQRRNTDDTCILTSRAGQPGTSVRKERREGGVLRNAAFASLDGRALTPEAHKLVAEINTRVVAQVTLDESKPGGVKTNRKMLRTATEAFVYSATIRMRTARQSR